MKEDKCSRERKPPHKKGMAVPALLEEGRAREALKAGCGLKKWRGRRLMRVESKWNSIASPPGTQMQNHMSICFNTRAHTGTALYHLTAHRHC